MTLKLDALNRRQVLAVTGAGLLAGGAGVRMAAAADVTIRQGYQTNIWGMPTYYLMKSGYLEKHGLKMQDFAVPSGNLTMQQMVARQVDLGTYAGPSFLIGHDKGGLVAIAQIETVGKTARDVVRKDLGITKIERTQGQEDRQPDRLLDRQHLRRSDRAGARPEEGRLPGSPHGREQHDRRAWPPRPWTPWSTSSPTTRSPRPKGIGNIIIDLANVDKVPVFMAATPDFVEKNPDAMVAYLKAWLDAKKDFKDNPKKVADVDLLVLHLEGLQDGREDLRHGDGPR